MERKEIGVFFFFRQKTACEIRLSLVGSGLCIRDRADNVVRLLPPLVIEESHLDEAMEKLDAACGKLDATLDRDAKAAGAPS